MPKSQQDALQHCLAQDVRQQENDVRRSSGDQLAEKDGGTVIAYYDLQLGRAVLKVAADNNGYGQRRQNGDGRGILQGGEKGVVAMDTISSSSALGELT